MTGATPSLQFSVTNRKGFCLGTTVVLQYSLTPSPQHFIHLWETWKSFKKAVKIWQRFWKLLVQFHLYEARKLLVKWHMTNILCVILSRNYNFDYGCPHSMYLLQRAWGALWVLPVGLGKSLWEKKFPHPFWHFLGGETFIRSLILQIFGNLNFHLCFFIKFVNFHEICVHF